MSYYRSSMKVKITCRIEYNVMYLRVEVDFWLKEQTIKSKFLGISSSNVFW